MAGITTSVCNSFKQELLSGTHVFGTDTFKAALIKTSPSGTYDQTTTNYSGLGADEVANGSGYTTGGQALTGEATSLSGNTAVVTFSNPNWTASPTITARGLLIFNSSKSNKAVAVYDFGGDVSVTNGIFTVSLPVADSTHGLIRIG